MKKTLLVVLSCIALTACTPPPQTIIQRIPFPTEEYSRLATSGTATIKGQAFLKTRGGDVKTAAGNEVLLNPVTSYSQQWYEVNYLRQELISQADPQIWKHIKKKIADAEGRFTFEAVPPGDYFIATTVVWEAPTGYRGALIPQGGMIVNKISINEGEALDIILTK